MAFYKQRTPEDPVPHARLRLVLIHKCSSPSAHYPDGWRRRVDGIDWFVPVAACAPSEPTHDDEVIYLRRDQTQAEISCSSSSVPPQDDLGFSRMQDAHDD